MDKSVYQRPNKPAHLRVRKREGAPAKALPELSGPIEVDTATECHVTPPDVAARMADYLGLASDCLTLEPSAGTGNLLAALFDAGHGANRCVAIERHYGLCQSIRQRFGGSHAINPLQMCFLDYAAQGTDGRVYSRIIMNPPFKHVRSHMTAALSLLGRGGYGRPAILVALVPITYHHEEAQTLEVLPNTTFTACAVNTQVVRFSR